MKALNTAVEFRAKIATHKAARFNFLDRKGRMGAGRPGMLPIHTVEVQFSDGTWLRCSFAVFEELGEDKFSLMTEAEWKASGLESPGAGSVQ